MDSLTDRFFSCDHLTLSKAPIIKFEPTPGPIHIGAHPLRHPAGLWHAHANGTPLSGYQAATACYDTKPAPGHHTDHTRAQQRTPTSHRERWRGPTRRHVACAESAATRRKTPQTPQTQHAALRRARRGRPRCPPRSSGSLRYLQGKEGYANSAPRAALGVQRWEAPPSADRHARRPRRWPRHRLPARACGNRSRRPSTPSVSRRVSGSARSGQRERETREVGSVREARKR